MINKNLKHMKKIIYSLAFGLALFAGACKDDDTKDEAKPAPVVAAPAVAVTEENTSLIQKFSGTRCGPCGSWGWTFSDEMITFGETDGKALYMGTFSQNFVAEGFITTTASDMDTKWAAGGYGYPIFYVNGSAKASRSSGVNTTAEKTMCKDAMTAQKSAPVVANTGVTYTVADGKMNIKASIKFFKESTGDYNVAFYVIENDAMWKQSGHPQGANPIPHHYVLRGSANGTWGAPALTGTIKAGDFKDLTGEMVVDPSWAMANVSVYAVIWKKNGTNYEFVNVSKSK